MNKTCLEDTFDLVTIITLLCMKYRSAHKQNCLVTLQTLENHINVMKTCYSLLDIVTFVIIVLIILIHEWWLTNCKSQWIYIEEICILGMWREMYINSLSDAILNSQSWNSIYLPKIVPEIVPFLLFSCRNSQEMIYKRQDNIYWLIKYH